MFSKIFARFLMRHFNKKEKEEGKKYQRHFKFDDGRSFTLYSNEYIEEEKARDLIEFVRKNIKPIDAGDLDELRIIIVEIMSAFFDFDAMVSVKVKEPCKTYEISIIRNGSIDLEI